jgi:hypothetical protein
MRKPKVTFAAPKAFQAAPRGPKLRRSVGLFLDPTMAATGAAVALLNIRILDEEAFPR